MAMFELLDLLLQVLFAVFLKKASDARAKQLGWE